MPRANTLSKKTKKLVAPSVTISEAVAEKLERLKLLDAALELSEYDEKWHECEHLSAEYFRLQSELAPMFIPLLQLLLDAGMLSVEVSGLRSTPNRDLNHFLTTSGSAQAIERSNGNRGNICIQAEMSGGRLTPEGVAAFNAKITAMRAKAASANGKVQ